MRKKKPIVLPWWGVLCWMIGCAPIVWLFNRAGRLDLALPTLSSVGMIGAAIALRWHLRREAWFWMTMAVSAGLHVPLIIFVHWTTKWVPAILITPIAFADLYAMLAVVDVVGKFVHRREPLEDERRG